MRLTIDNLDGKGAVDYTACLDATKPLTIERTLNAPSTVNGLLLLNGMTEPVRRGRVVIMDDAGTVLFTGYIATDPVSEYAGAGVAGPVYRTAFSAVSDEWLLNKQSVPLGGAGLAQAGGLLLSTLTQRTGANLLSTTSVASGRSVGVFVPETAQGWSANAAALAGSTYAAYRALGGALELATAGAVTHSFSDGDGTLAVSKLKTASIKELANDVTVTGAIEAAAYITEVFAGDGATTAFQLTEEPFIPARLNSSAYLVNDSFPAGTFNPQAWALVDPGAHLASGAGLLMNGGNGFDGQTTLTLIDSIEMGGTLVVEAGSVTLNAPSDGVLCGLYSGSVQRANCFVGYNVRQNNGTTLVTPMLNGAEVGTSYTVLSGHRYTLRIRLHCAETERVLQTYYAMGWNAGGGAVKSFGGGLVSAPMQAVFELVDLGVSSNTPATVLYDTASAGPIVSTPASCAFAACDSVQLFGAMGYCRIEQTGSAWIRSVLPSGQTFTRLAGAAGEGVDCTIATTGKITFLAGRIPQPGEMVYVTYRSRQRAVARMCDPASIAAEAAGDAPGTAAWLGKVVRPVARSTADCEAAAQAILSFATSRAAAVAGTYTAANPQQDIWPGDVLALTSNGATTNGIVRRITITDGMSMPELLTYSIAFANDWAEGLGLTLSEAIATDALLPQTALTGPANVLANLVQMMVVSVSDTAIQIDAGIDPPTGGGFEVRRRDGGFGLGTGADLVLRSPVRGLSIPRAAQVEQHFVRMYDGSNPPVYSRLSSAIFTNVPVS
ncbi:MAG TPA: hypothetical protein VGC07_06705 [Granulicella sp.]